MSATRKTRRTEKLKEVEGFKAKSEPWAVTELNKKHLNLVVKEQTYEISSNIATYIKNEVKNVNR